MLLFHFLVFLPYPIGYGISFPPTSHSLSSLHKHTDKHKLFFICLFLFFCISLSLPLSLTHSNSLQSMFGSLYLLLKQFVLISITHTHTHTQTHAHTHTHFSRSCPSLHFNLYLIFLFLPLFPSHFYGMALIPQQMGGTPTCPRLLPSSKSSVVTICSIALRA